MNRPLPQDQRELIDRYLEGGLSDREFTELRELLRQDAAVRTEYFSAIKMDTMLREAAGGGFRASKPARADRTRLLFGAGLLGGSMVAIALFLGVEKPTAAEIGVASANSEWVGSERDQGERLRQGDRIRLNSGSVELHFETGAVTRIHGPASFEITSNNSGFLHFGQAWSRADSVASEGFAIQTPSGRFVDRGTEFLTTARKDGFSQMQVSSGAVDAEVDGFERQRFETGSGIGIEPGEDTVLIRIESGDESPGFVFPTIPPPSNSDVADLRQGRCRVLLMSTDERKGRDNLPHPKSGPPELLIDGRSQTGMDQPGESFYFPDGADGSILLDLGDAVPVSRVHTYSWHLNDLYPSIRRRAVQRYTLWGAGAEKPAALPSSEKANGWTRIARVDTDLFFQVEEDPDRPAQQACAIHTNAPAMGDFRYLLFQVLPTAMPDGKHARHTFFGEIDVFGVNQPD